MKPKQQTPLQDCARGEILGRLLASLPLTSLALSSSWAQMDILCTVYPLKSEQEKDPEMVRRYVVYFTLFKWHHLRLLQYQ